MGAGLDKITGPASCLECKTAAAAALVVTHEQCGPLLQLGVVEEDQSDSNLLKPRVYGAYWLGSCHPEEEVRPGRMSPREPLEDDYDPRKPEYVREASEQEMAQTEAEQLRQQMLKLEVMLESRGGAEPAKWHVLQHYRHVLDQMRKRECEVLSSIGEQGESSDEGSGITSATSSEEGFSSLYRDGTKEFDVITRGETTSTRCSVKDLLDSMKDLEQNVDEPSCQVEERHYAADAAQRFCVAFQPGRSLVLSDLSGLSML